MKKLIHIHAKCDAFEIWEIKTEKQSQKRLIAINGMFLFANRHYKEGAGNLIVKTGVVNPKLPFKD